MTDAPSPYAPGTISDERLPPRPAGRASVFLVATFVMTLVTSGLYHFWLARAALMTGHMASIGLASALAGLPGALILLLAYLSDRVGLLGTRREGYLLVACLIMGIAWIILAVGSENPLAWIGCALPTGLAGAVSRVAIVGALAEIGRRRAATGRLAAAHVALAQLAEIAVLPATLLVLVSIAWSAGAAVGLTLALALLIAVMWDAGPPAVAAPAPGAGIPRFLGSRAFWTSAAILACAGVAQVPDLVMAQALGLGAYGSSRLATQWRSPAIMIGAAVVYLVVCRSSRFDLLLRFALIAKAAGLAVHALAAHATGRALPDSALIAHAAGDGLAAVALLDLAFRVAPPGREAFGAILLAGLPGVVTLLMGGIEAEVGVGVVPVAWLGAGAGIAGALAVSLLPPEIGRAPEGRPDPQSEMLGSPR